MTPALFLIEVAGWLGASLILGAYILLSAGKLKGDSPVYQWMNVIGAAGFILNSGYHGAIPSVAINVLWIGIGGFALWRIYKGAKAV
ncbi:MAG TPA: hypothetical protein PKV67_08570 [Hyphomonas sp.]|nr:hypothetical protein [Hyphomonas sp.]HRJ00818.1 hypothetical protein [Hyphomonas sp.]HRK69118.1 hypothetical protein [Hyphomonas sp.]